MKNPSLLLLRTISAFLLATCLGAATLSGSVIAFAQDKDKTKPKLSDAEAKAAEAVNTAPDAAAKLAAGGEFVKKYPKSSVRGDVAAYVASQIAQVPDGTQRLALAESFQKTFTADNELALIQSVILSAYVDAKRLDDAFTLASTVLTKQPDHVGLLTQMAFVGTEEAKKQNPKYAVSSQQYGLKAIELIEANKKPANIDDAVWERQKALLPRLYQSMGILSLVSGKAVEARTQLEKAAALDPYEPFSYVLIGGIVNDEYQEMAKSYKSMPEGKQKDEALKKATELMDKVIDLYAHAVAATDGKPEHKQLHDQLVQDLTPYYKYRHNQSTEGLQQLIDKYKAPPVKP